MGRNKGICTLCGKGGALSFEHVPPKAANNVPGVIMHTFEDWTKAETFDGPLPNGILQPEGMGIIALCKPCNEFLGKHYVNPHSRLVAAGTDIMSQLVPKLDEFDARPAMTVISLGMENIDRLACAKQIVEMVLVTCGRNVVEANPELERFVREPERLGLPPRYRLFLALTGGPAARTTGLCVRGTISTADVVAMAEVVYPPFAYALSFNGTPIWSKGEITSWTMATYGESTTVTGDLALGFTHTPFPCDLRSRGLIEAVQQEEDKA